MEKDMKNNNDEEVVLALFNHLDTEELTNDELKDKEYFFDRLDIWFEDNDYANDDEVYEMLYEMYLEYLYNKLV
jgi:hypothetical protein